jgi:hypothetical protein
LTANNNESPIAIRTNAILMIILDPYLSIILPDTGDEIAIVRTTGISIKLAVEGSTPNNFTVIAGTKTKAAWYKPVPNARKPTILTCLR